MTFRNWAFMHILSVKQKISFSNYILRNVKIKQRMIWIPHKDNSVICQRHGKNEWFKNYSSPLEVAGVHRLIADGTCGPALVCQGQVVEHAGPAEDVSAAGDVRCHRRVEADGAGGHLVAVDTLQKPHYLRHVSSQIMRNLSHRNYISWD